MGGRAPESAAPPPRARACGNSRQALQQPMDEQPALEAVAAADPQRRQRRAARRRSGRDGNNGRGGSGSGGGGALAQSGNGRRRSPSSPPARARVVRSAGSRSATLRPHQPFVADQRFGVEVEGLSISAKTGAAQRVPADLRRRLQGLPAADVEPVLRPGQADIEQPAVFLHLAVAPRRFFARRNAGPTWSPGGFHSGSPSARSTAPSPSGPGPPSYRAERRPALRAPWRHARSGCGPRRAAGRRNRV